VYWSGSDSTVTITNPLLTGDDIGDALAFAPGGDRSVVLAGMISGSGQIKVSANATATLDLTRQTSLTNTNTGGVEIGTGRVLIASGANLGGGTVNFGTGSNSTLVVSGSGTTVTNPMTIGTTGNTNAGTAKVDTNGGFLVIEGAIADRPGNLPGSLMKLGAGTLTLRAANTFTGTTTVQQGTLEAANAAALATTSVIVADGAQLTVAPFLQATAGGLAVASGGLVDVTSGYLTVTSGLSATELVAEILAGRGDGSWTGVSGITSSTAAAEIAIGTARAVGWVDNGDGSLAFAYAAPGDSNLDWQVDVLDAANVLTGGKFNTADPATWAEGDFNYDGVVDVLDAADFITTGLYNGGGYNPPPSSFAGASVAAVPEPVGLGMVGMVGMGVAIALLRGRHRRRP
jgi:autotransporter-associated beta strand protein